MTRELRPPIDPMESRYWDWKARLYWRLFNREAAPARDLSPEDVISRILECHDLADQNDSEGSP